MPAQSTSTSHRHHPYASASSSSSSMTAPAPAPAGSSRSNPSARKWATGPSNDETPASARRSPPRATGPPSPPRSRRDASETPPAGLGVAFGGRDGGKWWDEELPAPPSSLSSILDSFRRSGEGDRDLLLAILGAKKAEEERLTALIQTRLTILQARLSVHAAAASPAPLVSLPTPTDTMYSHSPRMVPHGHGHPESYAPERTPSLTSRASASSSTGPVSPTEAPKPHQSIHVQSHSQPRQSALYASYEIREKRPTTENFHLPPPANLWRRHSPAPGAQGENLPPIRVAGAGAHSEPVSPRSDGHNGLDMLLDAGRIRAE